LETILAQLSASPIQEIFDDTLSERQVRLFMKRDDLLRLPNMPPSVQELSGNKIRKLKYNLLEMQSLGLNKLITFGGAFSNHIHAVAAAGKTFHIETIGIIRGDRFDSKNATLAFAESCGMRLYFMNRTDFRDADKRAAFIKPFSPDAYILPEGGTNHWALTGSSEIVVEANQYFDAASFYSNSVKSYFAVAAGTGGTMAGMITALQPQQHLIGFSVLKGDFLRRDVTDLIENRLWQEQTSPQNWTLLTDYSFGGYAKWTPELIDFINGFKRKYQIALDPIYTGKMMFGLFDLIKKGSFPPHARIIAVHTGGLQGIKGFNQRFGDLIEV
jgi:1-aminocyclopropane-1-carboxylate deaminase